MNCRMMFFFSSKESGNSDGRRTRPSSAFSNEILIFFFLPDVEVRSSPSSPSSPPFCSAFIAYFFQLFIAVSVQSSSLSRKEAAFPNSSLLSWLISSVNLLRSSKIRFSYTASAILPSVSVWAVRMTILIPSSRYICAANVLILLAPDFSANLSKNM